MPGDSSSPRARAARKLSWSSRLTVFVCQPLSRSWRRVEGLAVDDMRSGRPYEAVVGMPYYTGPSGADIPVCQNMNGRQECQPHVTEALPTHRRRACKGLDKREGRS